MFVFKTKNETRNFVNDLKKNNKSVGFVPTMGCLHKGHLSLIDTSIKNNDETIVSIFVNPTQFGPNEDFNKYPRTINEDIGKCEELGVSAIFAPSEDEIYPDGKINIFQVIPPENYTNKLCGKYRPGHFDGVATVVTKLFNIIPANRAYFGQKDAQQLFIIKKMVDQLDIPVDIITCPTVREIDGLACSSRNLNLKSQYRSIANNLYQSLTFIKTAFSTGETDFFKISLKARKLFVEQFNEISLEYLVALDYNNLEPVKILKSYTLIAIAAKINNVRLIDNILLN